MKARRAQGMEISPAFGPRRETKPYGEAGEPMPPRKTSREGRRRPYQNRHRWGFLWDLNEKYPIRVAEFTGGNLRNAIAREAFASIVFDEKYKEQAVETGFEALL